MTMPLIVVVVVPLHATLHCRLDGHTTVLPEELPEEPPPLLLAPGNVTPLDVPLLDPLLPPLLEPLLAPPPLDEKPPPLLPPPHAGPNMSAKVEAMVPQLTASVRRFMTRLLRAVGSSRFVGQQGAGQLDRSHDRAY
jgi:hypothetical protein